jgi:hypothetical protein
MNTCQTCQYRDENGYCDNEMISESHGIPPKDSPHYAKFESENNSALRYGYYEEGAFWVGPNFGCIHHTPKPLERSGGMRPQQGEQRN